MAYGGRVYVNTGSFVDVWDGATAKRVWAYPAAPSHFSALVVADGRVLVAATGYLLSFNAAGCGATVCPPQWTTRVVFPGQEVDTADPQIAIGGVADGRAYLTAASNTLWLSSVDLATGNLATGSEINPNWHAIEYSPILAGNMLWILQVGEYDGYRTNCADTCPPTSRIPLPDAINGAGPSQFRFAAGGGNIYFGLPSIATYAYRPAP